MPAAERSRRLRWALRGLAFAVLLALVFVLGSINVPFLEPDEPSEVILLYVFSGAVFLAFVIYALVLTRYLVRLYTEHRRQVLGAKFKTKLVAAALALSLLPVVALFFISYALVNRTLGKWFPRPLENVRDEARALAERALEEEEERAGELAAFLAADPEIRRLVARRDARALESRLTQQLESAPALFVAVVDPAGSPLATHRNFDPGFDLTISFIPVIPSLLEPRAALAYTTRDEIGGKQFALARARIDSPPGSSPGAVIVARELTPALLEQVQVIERESSAYEALKSESKSYRWQALLILLLITVLLLLAATWSALQLAKQVTIPIQALAVATEEVSRGNFDHRVEVPAKDELGTLVSSFNQMTTDLGESRRNLERAVAELEHRRQWIETILESIPTGVLTLGPDLRLLRANEGARALLSLRANIAEGAPLGDLLRGEPAAVCAELVAQSAERGFAAGQMEFRQARQPDGQAERIAHVAVSVSALRGGLERAGQNQGYVLVLDDLTDLLKAEKAAAWQEVAQRIAHEIKNPLTPIQLSADRIRRYLERASDPDPVERGRSAELIAQCAALIAQEVQGLKTLVDEFSRFARFPVVEPAPTQLNEVVEGTLALYRDAVNGVRLTAELAPALPAITGDPALLRRVLVNLIDNATEAVSGAAGGSVVVRTRYLAEARRVELSVSDSGPGISPEHKERLFLPFFSTKPNGMGLGLAIVSRIVAEHRGRIRVEDNQPRGTRFVMEFPAASRAAAEPPAAPRAS
jgi:nitrogen fixation/metabolism regulation signal transduction histidine kinase